jgi:hypothetical protein
LYAVLLLACVSCATEDTTKDTKDAVAGETAGGDAGGLETADAPEGELAAEVGPDLPAGDVEADGRPPEAVEPACQPGQGCFLEACKDNADCHDGWCVLYLGEQVCSERCQNDCSEGWKCVAVQSREEVQHICVSPFANLCLPCKTAEDCASVGTEDACIRHGDLGSFCGSNCGSDQDCPASLGYVCKEVETIDGIKKKQCVPAQGECKCSEMAVEKALSTGCKHANEEGVCLGERVCSETGLSACDAATPAPETCNGLDDDCDDLLDEPAGVAGEEVPLCDDGDECTADSCPGEAGCKNEPLDQTPCSDESFCTAGDHCQAGVCVGDDVSCDDANGCTDDSCDPLKGCVHADNAAVCDDGDPCTENDGCKYGACGGTPIGCDCYANEGCQKFEDGNLCNGTLFCDLDELPYVCKVAPETVVTCPEPTGVDAVCLAPSCDKKTGVCSFVPAGGAPPCDDGSACTTGDACTGGKCVSGAPTPCDDKNVCTTDSCDPKAGCIHTNNTDPCTDANACTAPDVCKAGQCAPGAAVVCDDKNPCTDDSCDQATGCVFLSNDDLCNDGDACTLADHCAKGECISNLTDTCDDGNPCTKDSCTPATGCAHENLDIPCSDGNACTLGDKCDKGTGSCISGPVLSCNDGNPCTDDSCSGGACLHLPNQAPCSDGDPCTTGDACTQGKCLATGALPCDDGNPCTKDTCAPPGLCQHLPVDGSCNDGDDCSTEDHCTEGKCVGEWPPEQDCEDGNVCTADLCEENGLCSHPPLPGPCSDLDACTVGDQCQKGTCAKGSALSCDDGNPCTKDGCDPLAGCTHQPIPGACEDGNVCTTGDICDKGKCAAGSAAADCSDGNVCTDDACHPLLGCLHSTNSVPCDDGNACTEADVCQAGACKGGPAVSCDDQNVCTDDSCHPAKGCVHANNTAPCDDANVCTLEDLCQAGACVGKNPLPCNDANPCTDDGCDPMIGCSFIGNAAPCDDKDACTAGDVCKLGLCTAGAAVQCDDGNDCTADSCAPAAGCKNAALPNGTACKGGGGWQCFGGTCKQVPVGNGMVFLTSSNGTPGFYGYDVLTKSWKVLPQPPAVSYTQLTTDGFYVYLMGSNNMLYQWTQTSQKWSDVQSGPGGVTSSPIAYFKWTPYGFYYAKDLQTTMYYSVDGGGWNLLNLPLQASSAGSWDPVTEKLYIREGWNLGLIVFDPKTNATVMTWPNPTSCGENSRTGSYYSGSFYTREWSGPFVRMDVNNGQFGPTQIKPSEGHTSTDIDPVTGNLYVGPYEPTGTVFQVYNIPANTLTTLPDVPENVSNHSTIVFVASPK